MASNIIDGNYIIANVSTQTPMVGGLGASGQLSAVSFQHTISGNTAYYPTTPGLSGQFLIIGSISGGVMNMKWSTISGGVPT